MLDNDEQRRTMLNNSHPCSHLLRKLADARGISPAQVGLCKANGGLPAGDPSLSYEPLTLRDVAPRHLNEPRLVSVCFLLKAATFLGSGRTAGDFLECQYDKNANDGADCGDGRDGGCG